MEMFDRSIAFHQYYIVFATIIKSIIQIIHPSLGT